MSKRSRDEVDDTEGGVEQTQDEIKGDDEELEEDSQDDEEQQQQQQQQNQQQLLLASPPGFSPPGMSLRSGRKKRRRSKGTSGLTPTETGKKPNQKERASFSADEPMKDADTAQEGKDENEDMEDVNGKTTQNGKEDNGDDVAMSEVDKDDAKQSEKTTAPTTSSTEMNGNKDDGNNNNNNTRDQPPLKLRMPSQHTPATRSRAKQGATTTSTSATLAVAATLDAVNVSAVSAASSTTSNTISTRRLVFDTPPTDTNLLPNQQQAQAQAKSGTADDKSNGGTNPNGDDTNIYMTSPTTTKPSPASESDGHINPVPRSLFRTGSDILVNFTSAIPEILTNLVVPEPERLNSTMGGEDDNDDAVVVDENQPQTPKLGRTDVWMGILLIVYVLMTLTLGGGSLTKNVWAASEQTLTIYQHMFGMTPVPVASIVEDNEVITSSLPDEKETTNFTITSKPKKIKVVKKKVQKTVEKVVEVPKIVKVSKVVTRKPEKTVKPVKPPKKKKQKEVFVEDDTPSPLQPLLRTMTTTNSTMTKNYNRVTEELQNMRKLIVKEWDDAEKWDKSLKETRDTLQALVAHNSEGNSDQVLLSKINHAKRTLETTRTLSRLPIIRIFDEDVSLWNIPEPPVCPNKQPDLPPPPPADVVRSEMFFDTNRDVRQRIQENVKDIMANEDLVKLWIKESVSKLMPQLDLTDLEEIGSHHDELEDAGEESMDVNDVLRLTKEKLYDLIDERLEVERADRTGRIDYASLQAGARIIQSGTRSTSPSLVDNLPLFNRILAYWRLRFYGHGPEAALTPTFPKNALGQCWSFENNALSKYNHWRNSHKLDKSTGKYGTLTIRLPRPVQVSSVIIEHPPKETTKQVKSAIKNFRVVGYEDSMANGKPWPLGQFSYGIDEMRSMQEFDVNTETSDGSTIPMLQSITLAIDSNYGFPYACLYRFRVHGEGELMIDDPEYE